jgi:hypothetical protein
MRCTSSGSWVSGLPRSGGWRTPSTGSSSSGSIRSHDERIAGRSFGLFVPAALVEIGGAYLVWIGLRDGDRPSWRGHRAAETTRFSVDCRAISCRRGSSFALFDARRLT